MTKMSMKEATMYADRVYRVGYCDLWHALGGSSKPHKVGYNAGVYGWNCDIFEYYFKGLRIVITTGYRNMRGESIPHELAKLTDDRAKALNVFDFQSYAEYQGALEQIMFALFEQLENQ